MNLNSHVHEYQTLRSITPSMVWDGSESLKDWQTKARAKLMELLGLPYEKTDPDVRIEYEIECEDFFETRFLFQSEPGYYVPCHLLVPKSADKAPLTICGMGHGGGMHVALGRAKREADTKTLEEWPHRAMGLRAIREGRCALVLEPRSFGEASLEGYGTSCLEAAKIAMLSGRTLLGGRVWDVMRALDVITECFPQVDMSDIVMTGNSGGGTVTYYAACLDERITLAAPCCSVCTFEDSIAAMPHCLCNHVPGIRKYFEMGDMAAMIAPRKLIVAAGRMDPIFLIFGVRRAYQQVQAIYQKAGVEQNCALIIGEKGHLNYADLIWAKVHELK